jgi:hypothetical protein
MAKLTDPDSLNQGVEVVFTASAKTVALNLSGNLTTDGVTLQCLYSFCKEEWKNDENLIKYPFPLVAITPEQFEFSSGWKPANQNTVNLIRDAGFAIASTGTGYAEKYFGCITLGSVGTNDQIYYQQSSTSAPANIVLSGAVNQCIKIYGSGNGEGVSNTAAENYASYFKIFTREYAKKYSSAQLSDIGVTTLTYQAYRFPLANSDDLKITHIDAIVATATPYTDVTIDYLSGTLSGNYTNGRLYPASAVVYDSTNSKVNPYPYWYITPGGGTSNGATMAVDSGITDWSIYLGQRVIGASAYPFNKIIDAATTATASATTEQIYEKIQYLLRQSGDIDFGTGAVSGKTTAELLTFVGDTLVTEDGVFIDDFLSEDTNTIDFYDINGTLVRYPYVAAGNLSFNSYLVTDTGGLYAMFFTSLTSGKDFGTASAIVVNDNSGSPISGNIDATTVGFTFDYDGNIQGGRTAGTDANVTVVAIGLETAQYVAAESTLTRSNANTISVVSPLERNYSNA